MQIYHTLNSGLCLKSLSGSLIIDAIHNGNDVGMSLMPETLYDDLRTQRGIFNSPDGVLFTHLHKDHFWKEAVQRYVCECSPNMLVYGPSCEMNHGNFRQLSEKTCCFRVKDMTIYAIRTIHDGEIFRRDPHNSFLVENRGTFYLIAGDAKFSDRDVREISRFCCGVDQAFVNIYQIFSKESRCFLKQMNCRKIWLYHLPEVEDDTMNYWRLAKQCIRQAASDGIEVEILRHMSWI